MPTPHSSAARRLSQLAAPGGAHSRTVRDFRDGGRVRGTGTPTSDSIKAHLSDEEYVLPADTVKAVGVSALDALRKATHRPTKRSGHGYADGGLVKKDDIPKPNSFGDAVAAAAQPPGAVQVVGAGAGAGAGTAASPARLVQPSLSQSLAPPAAASIPSPVRAAFDSAGVTGRSNSFGDAAAAKLDPTVSRVPTGASAVDQIPTSGNRPAPPADGSQNNPFNTEVGRNIMNSAAALPGLGGIGQVASTGGRISSAFNAASRAVNVGSGVAAGGGLPVVFAGPANAATPSTVDVGRTASVGSGAGRGSPNDPNRKDVDPSDPRFGAARDFTSELNKVPDNLPKDMRSGVVLKTVDPKTGRVTYSGRDVGLNGDGQVQMVDGMGKDLKMLGQPKGNFVQGLDANGKPNSFATPGMNGPVFTDGRAPVAAPGGSGALPDGSSSGPSRNGAVYQPGRTAQPASTSGGGRISAQNMAAADALASRNDGSTEIRAAMNKEQYDREVSGAQEFWRSRSSEMDKPMNKRQLAVLGMRMKQEQFDAEHKLEQAKYDLASQGVSLDNQSKARLGHLQDKVANGDPKERSAAAELLRAISGRENQPRWSMSAVQGGTDADGVRQPGYAVMGDQASGEYKIISPGRNGGPSPAPKYPEGQALRGKDGKTYVVKNGVPVLK